jgi:hypothetical protein
MLKISSMVYDWLKLIVDIRNREMTKEVNWDQIDQMLIAGCNGMQCAAAVGIHHDTLYHRCEQDKKTSFSVYSQSKRAHGDALLHAAQYQKAIKEKHPTMLIWLGKQRLNQKENANDGDLNHNLASLIKALDCGDISQNNDNGQNVETK